MCSTELFPAYFSYCFMCVSSSAIARFDVVLAPAGKRDYGGLPRIEANIEVNRDPPALINPITGIVGRSTRAANDHAIATPPNTVMPDMGSHLALSPATPIGIVLLNCSESAAVDSSVIPEVVSRMFGFSESWEALAAPTSTVFACRVEEPSTASRADIRGRGQLFRSWCLAQQTGTVCTHSIFTCAHG
jgi:hypothetical protein